MKLEKPPEKLGERIRRVRLGKGLKVVDIANSTGLTSSSISQVERSKISPSISTLKKIAAALDHPLGDFFANQDGGGGNGHGNGCLVPFRRELGAAVVSPVVHRSQRKLLSPGKGVTFQLLNPDMSGPIEFIYNIYEPGSGTGTEQYSHPGFECGLILQGELEVTIRDKSYRLVEGDSITFWSSEPHSKVNPGDIVCVCVWANTPPWF
ncbi:MAG: cupin domain-containing protein [Planctomycetota bacterium]|jgi:transcriptional regulator with XRE-family HTH domain/mannose-6-phosphate isomerase-like protein (cupin superfamily)|nr:cupin domain-containing protein [Planctomycetota bacterium]